MEPHLLKKLFYALLSNSASLYHLCFMDGCYAIEKKSHDQKNKLSNFMIFLTRNLTNSEKKIAKIITKMHQII